MLHPKPIDYMFLLCHVLSVITINNLAAQSDIYMHLC